jgi:hypothetical protein
VSAEPIRSHADQLRELAVLIAAELRGGSSASDPQPLVDAAELGRQLGLSRAAIYANADRLGVVRLGDGSRARMRFSVERATEALRPAPAAPSTPTPRSSNRRSKRRAHVLQSRARSKALPALRREAAHDPRPARRGYCPHHARPRKWLSLS